MKCWPIPKSFSRDIHRPPHVGGFWADRGDRFHCGLDIYATAGSEVVSMEAGKVISSGVFTSPGQVPYWNQTYYVCVLSPQKKEVFTYGELQDISVRVGEEISAGQLLGHVGTPLNDEKITTDAPEYVQQIKKAGNLTMLHLEMHHYSEDRSKNYILGNWFDPQKPESLIDPTPYLESIAQN